MVKFIGLCVVLLLSGFANAQVNTAPVATLQLNWAAPVARENGVALTTTEIGGYEIRYKLKSATISNSIVLPNGSLTSFALAIPTAGEYDVQIAAYDTDMNYSSFVALGYKLNLSPPKSVNGFNVRRLTIDVQETCAANPNCKVVKGDGR